MTTLVKNQDDIVSDMRRIISTSDDNHMIWNVLVGPHGAVQFAFLIHEKGGPMDRLIGDRLMGFIDGPEGYVLQAADVGYHGYEPMYPSQEPMECHWLLGTNRCYYDGSSLHATEVMAQWEQREFSYEWLWNYLFQYYRQTFE